MSAFGRYELHGRLGRGSLMETFRAKSYGVEGFEKTLVVKRLLPELGERARLVERFVALSRNAFRLSHANVVQLVDLGHVAEEGAGGYYQACEFVHGTDLRALLARARGSAEPFPPALGVYVIAELAKALEHAHRRVDERMSSLDIVHGGVCPSNVLLSWEGEVKLSDFCVALALDELPSELAAERRGPRDAYRSPEARRGDRLDRRADVFSLGVLLRELLTQLPPRLDGHVEASNGPDAPQSEIFGLAARASQDDPEARFENAAQLYEELLLKSYSAGMRATATDLSRWMARLRELPAPVEDLRRVFAPSVGPPRSTGIRGSAGDDARSYVLRARGRFVGRKQELSRFGQQLAYASRGRLVYLALLGEPGIGKSRILVEISRRLKRRSVGVAYYLARCEPYSKDAPHSAVTAMLRALAGLRSNASTDEIRAVEPRLVALGLQEQAVRTLLAQLGLSDQHARTAGPFPLHTAISSMLASLTREQLHVLVWDDAQDMDEASASLLASLGDSLGDSRCAFVFAVRSNTSGGGNRINTSAVVEVGPLAADDVTRLVASRLGAVEVSERVVQVVRARANGHPVLTEELLEELAAAGAIEVVDGSARLWEENLKPPENRSPLDVLADAARQLDEPAQDLIKALAVLGGAGSAEVLTAMLGADSALVAGRLAELGRRGFVGIDAERQPRLYCRLLRDALLAGLDREQERDLHRAAARALANGPHAPRGHAHRVGEHLLEAGESDEAADWFAKSGLALAESGRLDQAFADLGRALVLADLDARADEELAHWVRALARVARHARTGPWLARVHERINAHLATGPGGDLRLRTEMAIDLAQILGMNHHTAGARRLLAAAARQARDWPELEVRAERALAEMALSLGEYTRALSLLEGLHKRTTEERERCHVELALACATAGAGRHDEARRWLERASAIGVELALRCERHRIAALVEGLAGNWECCAIESAKAAELGRMSGSNHEVAESLHQEGDAWLRHGEEARAYAVLKSALSMAREAGSERLVNSNHLLLAYLEALRGSRAAQRQLGERLALAEARVWTRDVSRGRYLLGALLARDGSLTPARNELMLAQEIAEQAGDSLTARDCAETLARL
jgi:serine/threonine protein kinase/tetratricopeptide (TPR) repeat protein